MNFTVQYAVTELKVSIVLIFNPVIYQDKNDRNYIITLQRLLTFTLEGNTLYFR